MSYWLSHHHPSELHRTYRVGRRHLCARCVGVYPVLVLTVFAQWVADAPLITTLDALWAVGLMLPALVDWVLGQRDPTAGSNARRTLTGALAGAALGRSLYVHFQQPLPWTLTVQIGLALGALAVGVWIRIRGRSSS